MVGNETIYIKQCTVYEILQGFNDYGVINEMD